MLSIVIPAGGGIPRLRCALACLASAIRSGQEGCEVIVVNDGAAPGVRACVESLAASGDLDLQMVEIPRGGRSVARNAGAAIARGERILFIDSDVLLEAEALRFHATLIHDPSARRVIYRGTIAHLPWLAAFEDPVSGGLTAEAALSLRGASADSCLLISRRLSPEAMENPAVLREKSRSTPFQKDLARWFRENPHDVIASWIGCTGGQISIDRRVFDELGGFDEEMGLRWGAEDLEFGYRAVQAGIPVRHAEAARCYHMDHSIGGRQGDHEWALGYFAARHGNEGVLRVADYFNGRCSLEGVLEACHVAA